MLYTVKEAANLTGITVKTLYHYHKIGLLTPQSISDAGYRLYSMKELEQLQRILFFRELDFSLKDIKKVLEDEPSRQLCLTNQYELLYARRQRLDVSTARTLLLPQCGRRSLCVCKAAIDDLINLG
ncbi:putative transcriptional regulator [Desulfosporosinus orientis DSM 765]|uniref:Putative transcriptional regulator n=1 Tax=Desulfosporosinus orientis (strain ATCC 19365 / DSM 765 / NCIMB 8382 / VKM B-1628 / Singapore I) TaxID=768706 RepID=G7WCG2_DESOD|nr:putative transcriptional regulator [Desulfosporosinus orientis DSM 765]